MDRRAFLARLGGLAAAAMLPGLGGCKSSHALRVAIHTWIGYETLKLAREFNWLAPGVELVETPDISVSADLLQAGKIEAACLTLDEALRLRGLGVPLTLALVFDVSAGADVVMARPEIRTPADLAGKRIGIEKSALGSLVLGLLLDAAKLPRSAVDIHFIPLAQHVAAWRRREVDAVVTFEPNPTLLLREGAHRLYDSREFPDTVFDVLAVRGDRADGLRNEMQSLLTGHFRGLRHLQMNRQDAIYRIADREGITPAEVQKAFAGVIMPTLQANREYLDVRNGRLIAAVQRVSGLMVKSGYLEHEDSMADVVDPGWLPAGQEV